MAISYTNKHFCFVLAKLQCFSSIAPEICPRLFATKLGRFELYREDLNEELAIFSTKIDELNVSKAIVRGRHFESLFPSASTRRLHQARVIYYSNSCATHNVEYLLETFKLTLVLVITALDNLTLITIRPRRIFFVVCHLMQGQSAIS